MIQLPQSNSQSMHQCLPYTLPVTVTPRFFRLRGAMTLILARFDCSSKQQNGPFRDFFKQIVNMAIWRCHCAFCVPGGCHGRVWCGWYGLYGLELAPVTVHRISEQLVLQLTKPLKIGAGDAMSGQRP